MIALMIVGFVLMVVSVALLASLSLSPKFRTWVNEKFSEPAFAFIDMAIFLIGLALAVFAGVTLAFAPLF